MGGTKNTAVELQQAEAHRKSLIREIPTSKAQQVLADVERFSKGSVSSDDLGDSQEAVDKQSRLPIPAKLLEGSATEFKTVPKTPPVIIRRSIYDITQEALALGDLLEESGGELTEEIEEAILQVQTDFQGKAHNYGFVILQQQADADMLDKEIKRLQAQKQAKDKSVERLKSILLNCMDVLGIEKIQGKTITLSTRKTSSVEILDPGQIPAEYMGTPKPPEPSKTLIKDALKEGIRVPGAEMKTGKSLQIK